MNILEATAAILHAWENGQNLTQQQVEALRAAYEAELHAGQEHADKGYLRDLQHDARERVARWGRRSDDDRFRFVRGCGADNDLSLYAFNGDKYAALTIDEKGEAVVIFSDRATNTTDVAAATLESMLRLFGRVGP